MNNLRAARAMTASFALAIIACAVGCWPSVEGRFVGTWDRSVAIKHDVLDAEKAATKDPLEHATIEAVRKSLMSIASLPHVAMKLNADGTMSENGPVDNSTGTWELKSIAGQQAVIVVTAGDSVIEMELLLDDDFMKGTGGFAWECPDPYFSTYMKYRFVRK